MKNITKNLRLVAYDAAEFDRLIPEEQLNGWFMAEACARHVYVTRNPEDKIPDQLDASNNVNLDEQKGARIAGKIPPMVLEGEEAYTYLLMMMTGLINKRRGDPHAKGQVVQNYKAWSDGDQAYSEMKELMKTAFRDAKTIRNEILSELTPHSNEPALTARKMLQIKPDSGQSILIVGDKDHITANTFKILGRHCSKIYIANPKDGDELEDNYQTIIRERKNKKLSTEVEKVLTSNLTQEFLGDIDHVFICSAMNSDKEFEKGLIENWKNSDDEKSLVHLRGVPKLRGKTDGEWTQLTASDGFISREMIDLKQQSDIAANGPIFDNAVNACYNCANSLTNNKRPLTSFLSLPPDDYRHRTSAQSSNLLRS